MIRIHAGFKRGIALLFIILNACLCLRAQAQSYGVVSRGPDWKVWQKTVIQNGVTNVLGYTQLETGLCYTNEYGQLVDADDTISILPGGGAVANHARHTVTFPSDIYNGVIQITTPDGRQLQSRPVCVMYDDGSNTVCIATLTNAVGYLTASNQVTYRNAFVGFKGDLVCTFRKSGFEADLVFRQRPPTPADYGLDASYSTLELATEFFNTADPQQIPAGSDDWYGLQDSTLKFGKLTMTHGKAFAFTGTNSTSQPATPVYKSWQHIDGRTFLIEAVPLLNIAENLDALPLTARNENSAGKGKKWAAHLSPVTHHTSLAEALPPAHPIIACTNRIELALNETRRETGVVLDYTTVDDGSDTYTFGNAADYGTYYISGIVNLTGVTTIDAGAILKYDPGAQLWCDSVTCATTVDQPAILTSANDDSVGDVIAGSTGTPVIDQSVETGDWTIPGAYLCFGDEGAAYQLQHLRVKYAHCVVADMSDKGGSADEADDCQFINCGTVFFTLCGTWTLNNDLFSGCEAIFSEQNGLEVDAVDVTADHCWTFINDDLLNGGQCTFTNSLITDVTTMMAVTNWSGWVPYTYPTEIYLDHTVLADTTNGFWVISSVASSQIASSAGIYASAAAASNYLAAGSSYHNAGTTNIDPVVLAELQTMTTYTPQDGGWPDTNGTDLGYHYSTNEDSDFDGIPDWWIWQYFGNYNYNGTNLDANGNTLLYDYQNSLDPNIIIFTVSVTNNYVNISTPDLGLNITAGSPGYYAVSIDDTNYATNAVWQAYTGTNLTASLGSVEGWHQLWIGLKGPYTNATVAWEWKRLKLDLTPPLIIVTNPVSSTVSLPLVQLQGYCPEALSSITYDLSNAVTLTTNQLVEILGQDYGTNTAEFTTNYFQAPDVLLTNGVNLLTFHATDLAGNTTNFSCELDYTPKTNAPVVQLLWPTNGMEICGSNIVCSGTVDDSSAKVIIQLVDGNGNTSFAISQVGRDGTFYSGNLVLTAGANSLTYTVTDSSGLTTTTNIAVTNDVLGLAVDVGLTVDSVAAGQSQITGTIDDDSYTVYVNGVIATNDGLGNWSTLITPIGVGGGMITVTATGSGGSTTLQQVVQPPQGIFISQYHNYGYLTDATGSYFQSGDLNWVDGVGGSGDFEISGVEQDFQFWPGSQWPVSLPGGVEQEFTGSGWITNTIGGPGLNEEHCDELGEVLTDSGWWLERRTADTEMKLATGGPLGSTQKRLWCLTASATAYADNDIDRLNPLTVPPEQIQINGRSLSTNGNLWCVLADNQIIDVTPRVNADNYTSAENTNPCPSLTASANGTNLTTGYAVFCVGQSVQLTVNGTTANVVSLSNYHWVIDNSSTYVDASSNAVPYAPVLGSVNYYRDPSVLTNASPYIWWVSGGEPQLYTVSGYCDVTFTDGSTLGACPIHGGSVLIYRPQVNWNANITGPISVDKNYEPAGGNYSGVSYWLHFGGALTNSGATNWTVPGITFTTNLINEFGYTNSSICPTQVVNSVNTINCNTNGQSIHSISADGLDNALLSTNQSFSFYDIPGTACHDSDYRVSDSSSYSAFLMFQLNPSFYPNSIQVPLRVVQWQWSAVATVV